MSTLLLHLTSLQHLELRDLALDDCALAHASALTELRECRVYITCRCLCLTELLAGLPSSVTTLHVEDGRPSPTWNSAGLPSSLPRQVQ